MHRDVGSEQAYGAVGHCGFAMGEVARLLTSLRLWREAARILQSAHSLVLRPAFCAASRDLANARSALDVVLQRDFTIQ